MDHNLIPPFMQKEAEARLNDAPKIHQGSLQVDDHAITFPEIGLRMPLGLWGVFSYFPTSKPSVEELKLLKMCMCEHPTDGPHMPVHIPIVSRVC
eukprot:4630205-Ditylum_brightwellii.AAC.1